MSIIHSAPAPRLTADQLTVPVASEVFAQHSDAAFYIGVVALPGNIVLQPNEDDAASKLRANVYIDEKGFLPPEARNAKGGESDSDDFRSVRIVALENRGQDNPPHVVGNTRLVLKRSPEDTLPAERYFPEAFAGENAASAMSAEVSRFIARHPDRHVQGTISLGLIRGVAAWLVNHGRRPAFAVVEASLARMFDNIELPYESMGPYERLEEYGGTRNKPIRIEPAAVFNHVRAEKHVASPVMRAFFGETYVHKGMGYFDETLTRSIA